MVDFEDLGWSPDGKHLSFMSAGVDGVSGWQINIADIDFEGDLTDLRRLKLDPDSSGEQRPNWSPDSSQVAFLLEKDFKRQVGIFNADGTGFRVIGPETSGVNDPWLHLVARWQDAAHHRVSRAGIPCEKPSGKCGRSTSPPARRTKSRPRSRSWQRLAP